MIQVQAQVQPEQLLRQGHANLLQATTKIVTQKLCAVKHPFEEKASSPSKIKIRSKSSGTATYPILLVTNISSYLFDTDLVS